MVTHRIVQLGDPNLPKFERMIEEMGAQIARRVALVGDAIGLMFYVDRERKRMRKCLKASFGDVLIRWNPFVALDFSYL